MPDLDVQDMRLLEVQAALSSCLMPSTTFYALQSLYERRVLSYPRTNSAYFPRDAVNEAIASVHLVARVFRQEGWDLPDTTDWRPNMVWFDDRKVHEHTGIMPLVVRAEGTGLSPEDVVVRVLATSTADERLVYHTVARAFVMRMGHPSWLADWEAQGLHGVVDRVGLANHTEKANRPLVLPSRPRL